MLVTPEDRQVLADLFVQAQAAHPSLRVNERVATLIGGDAPAPATAGRFDNRPVAAST